MHLRMCEGYINTEGVCGVMIMFLASFQIVLVQIHKKINKKKICPALN